jgi:hypothetical protein
MAIKEPAIEQCCLSSRPRPQPFWQAAKSGPSARAKVRFRGVPRATRAINFGHLPLVPKELPSPVGFFTGEWQLGNSPDVISPCNTRASDTRCYKPYIHPAGSGLRISATQNRRRASPAQRRWLSTPPNELSRKLWAPRKESRLKNQNKSSLRNTATRLWARAASADSPKADLRRRPGDNLADSVHVH